jgi:hypothetical protein
MTSTQNELRLAKGRHLYVFTYCSGGEAALLAELVRLADDETCDFDWFDAAVLGYQLGASAEPELETAR